MLLVQKCHFKVKIKSLVWLLVGYSQALVLKKCSVSHRMTLADHVHSSQLMEWHSLGITTLKHAICGPNIFLKLKKKQIRTNFIYLTSLNFVAIPHVSYRDKVNPWKNLWKFRNCLLCRNKSGPSPYSMLQHIGRVATPKLVATDCLRYLQTTLIMGGGVLVSEIMQGIVVWMLKSRNLNKKQISLLKSSKNYLWRYIS